MSDTRLEIVYVRWWNLDRLTTTNVTLIWHIEVGEERVVRRVLIDADTGEVLDETWLDGNGRVRSWAKQVRRARPARPESVRID